MTPAPTVRLAVTTALLTTTNGNGRLRYPFHKDFEMPPPTVRLALSNGQAERNGTLDADPPAVPTLGTAGGRTDAPALLVSYVYLPQFIKNRASYYYRDVVLDSGAFSAHHSGVEIKLADYIDCCKRLKDTGPTFTEFFALDVIGDWKESLKNAEKMWKAGVEAIPCYHVGEPESVLTGIAKDYPKIALGGAVGFRDKVRWAEQCFARIWPKKVHGFGYGAKTGVMALPWHSVDATSWEVGPCKFGRWATLGAGVSVRGSKQNLRGEVQFYLQLEKDARAKWAGAMKQLENAEKNNPVVRLAVVSPRSVGALSPPTPPADAK